MSVNTMPPEASHFEPEVARNASRRWILLLLLLVLLGAGGFAAWWFGWIPQKEAVEPGDGEIVVLEPLTTTLGEANLRHARVTMAVVLTEGEPAELVARHAPLLQDALLREVAAMDADELRSSQGSETLRARLNTEAKSIWGEEVVRRVLLTELLMQ